MVCRAQICASNPGSARCTPKSDHAKGPQFRPRGSSGPGRHPVMVRRPPLHDAYFSSPLWREDSLLLLVREAKRSCASRMAGGVRGNLQQPLPPYRAEARLRARPSPKGERRKLRPLAWQKHWRPAGGFSSAPAVTCHQACKPGSESALRRAMAIHLGRSPHASASCNQPGRGSSGRDWRVSPPRRPYSVLLPVGFAVPPLLPETRCALTAPFHPYLAIAA